MSRCLRCQRPLSGSRAVRRGYGWRCYARILRAARVLHRFGSPASLKAEELLLDGGVVRVRASGVFRVVSSDGRGRYWTSPDACNCRAGLFGVLCHHRVAVTLLVAR